MVALFHPVSLEEAPYPKPFECFWVSDPHTGSMVPNYFSLLPVWLALCYKLGGLPLLFHFNLMVGLVSLLLLVGLGRQIFQSPAAGWMAALLLSTNLAQIWLVRSPFSEIPAQMLLLGGLWLLALGRKHNNPRICLAAGTAWGAALFARPDSFLLVPVIIIGIALIGVANLKEARREWLAFLASFALIALYAAVHVISFSYFYLITTLDALWKTSNRWEAWAGILLLAGISCLFLRKGKTLLRRFYPDPKTGSRRAFRLTAGLLLALFLYLYFLRPMGNPTVYQPTGSFYDKVSFRLYDELNLVRLGWYMTPAGLALAFAGLLLLVHRLVRRHDKVLVPFAALLLVFGAFYLYKSRAMPDNYWVIRRYAEIVIPGFLLLAAWCLTALVEKLKGKIRPAFAAGIAGILFLWVLGWQVGLAWPVRDLRELEYSYSQLKKLAQINGGADILLVEDGNFKFFLPGPLKFLFHKTIYVFARRELDGAAFDRLMDRWRAANKQVRILTSEEHSHLESQRYTFFPVDCFVFSTRMMENPVDRLPRRMQDLVLPVQIYEVRPASLKQGGIIEMLLGRNFGFRTSGFYQGEQEADGTSFRWAGGEASVELPGLETDQEAILALQLSRPTPSGTPPAPLEVRMNSFPLGSPQIAGTVQGLELPIPSRIMNRGQEKNLLTFRINTYSPARLGLSPDIRELGFKLYRIQLKAAGKALAAGNPSPGSPPSKLEPKIH
jgi:hypothetical protein